MVKKIERAVLVLILCLSTWLAYSIFEDQFSDFVSGVKNAVQDAAGRDETEESRETEETKETAEHQETEDQPAGNRSHYDAREAGRAPVVKDQMEFGTCWAVTASSALEAALLPGEHLVFSADHISMKNTYGRGQEEGGGSAMIMSYLAGWMGPVTEEEDPYGDGYSPDGLEPVRHIQEIQMLREKDLQAVKELVYRCGSVSSSFYMDMENSAHSSVFYNEFQYAYCYNGEKEANHDVLIIGWNDQYPKENFSVDVKRDGAFICQNSWGDRFGENGVFYVSYEDAWIGSSCTAYTAVEPTDNYQYIYQTDLCGWIGQIGYESEQCFFANAYTAAGQEKLSAVGFYATGQDTWYTVYVAENFTNRLSLSGKVPAASGTLQNPGYYTVDLDQNFSLEKGQRFAVIVEICTPGSDYPVAAEYQADENSSNVTIEDGEGYLSTNGFSWENTEESYGCNVCLKAYTVNDD